MRSARLFLFVLSACLLCACGQPVYPARPEPRAGPPVVDLEPSRVLVHISSTLDGLKALFEAAVPPNMEGDLNETGTRKYFYERGPIELKIADGRVTAVADLEVGVLLPVIGRQSLELQLELGGEPVVSPDYKARLQNPLVKIGAGALSVRAANVFLGVLGMLEEEMKGRIEAFAFDLSPYVIESFNTYAQPYELPLGEASGCLAMRLSAIEAGPTVLAGGFEKDIALTIAPSVTLPCTPPDELTAPPRLANVASIPTGPFRVTIPVAARYDELAKTMSLAFTDGKLYLSADHPDLYVTEPEVYASDGQLVVKLSLRGSPSGLFAPELDGDIYFSGHPVIEDNELTVPDIEPTVDTQNLLLEVAASVGKDRARDLIRTALRLDIGERLTEVRKAISKDFHFADGLGCLRTDVNEIEVTDVFTHAGYLRIYVQATAQAAVYVPCPTSAPGDGEEGDALAGGEGAGSGGVQLEVEGGAGDAEDLDDGDEPDGGAGEGADPES